MLSGEVFCQYEILLSAPEASADEPEAVFLQRMLASANRSIDKADAQRHASLRIMSDKPIAISISSDWHVASHGTDIASLIAYADYVAHTPRLYAIGVGGVYASQFHLLSHSVFKALLFLGAGAVIHAVGTRDMRLMGGLGPRMRFTRNTFVIGALALAGIPILNGFWSKELILEAGLRAEPQLWAYIFMLFGVGLTALYTTRMVYLVFFGEERSHLHAHDAQTAMKVSLGLLALGALTTWLLAGPLNQLLASTLPFHEFHELTTNKLIFAPGLLSGTVIPNSGRILVGSKSPLTQTIKEANSGGTLGHVLAKLDIKALVIENKPKENLIYILEVSQRAISLVDGSKYKGLGNYGLAKELRKAYGEDVSIASIGPCGEMKMASASIAFTDIDGHPCRHAARGGLGAVMGAKGLKAIVLDEKQGEFRKPTREQDFKEAVKETTKAITEHPRTPFFRAYGTSGAIDLDNERGSLVTRNAHSGQFEGFKRLNAEAMIELQKVRGGRIISTILLKLIFKSFHQKKKHLQHLQQNHK